MKSNEVLAKDYSVMEYMTVILRGNMEFLLKIVTVQDLWFTHAGSYECSLADWLYGEGKRETRAVRKVDQEFGSISAVLIDAEGLDSLSR
jgi:hypothetical protein